METGGWEAVLRYVGCGERTSEASLEMSSEKELSSGDTPVSVIPEAFKEIELEGIENPTLPPPKGVCSRGLVEGSGWQELFK